MKVTITVADGEAAVAVTSPAGAERSPATAAGGDAGAAAPTGGESPDPGAAVDAGGPPSWLTESVGRAGAVSGGETPGGNAGGPAVGG
ncbi:hypothetical protein [Streptomyces albireticuli]|uniref:hypothetical protein n=1 Tax=Streptomyces albireticuli TaxID=1940 RepID=UPI001E561EB6|nr:hypothetical protein [Streptomyces albireticuli]MCD9144228.1 hypothetical protein [Streptomyces albireticuli]MCD9162129.1 hypothetical protein [Streptomyces albireticuli]MCD9193865.1 hypothetical protein [Streptomyces albireticuli]